MPLTLTPLSPTALPFGTEEGSTDGWGVGEWGGERWGSGGFELDPLVATAPDTATTLSPAALSAATLSPSALTLTPL